jgi:hypothetical protein
VWNKINRGNSHQQTGYMGCVGWRGAYESNVTFGKYKAQRRTPADVVNKINKLCEDHAAVLTLHLQKYFPLLVAKMLQQMKNHNAPCLEGTCYAFTAITSNYISAERIIFHISQITLQIWILIWTTVTHWHCGYRLELYLVENFVFLSFNCVGMSNMEVY